MFAQASTTSFILLNLNRACAMGEVNHKFGRSGKNFSQLVNKVYVEGMSVDLKRDDKIIARLTPA